MRRETLQILPLVFSMAIAQIAHAKVYLLPDTLSDDSTEKIIQEIESLKKTDHPVDCLFLQYSILHVNQSVRMFMHSGLASQVIEAINYTYSFYEHVPTQTELNKVEDLLYYARKHNIRLFAIDAPPPPNSIRTVRRMQADSQAPGRELELQYAKELEMYYRMVKRNKQVAHHINNHIKNYACHNPLSLNEPYLLKPSKLEVYKIDNPGLTKLLREKYKLDVEILK